MKRLSLIVLLTGSIVGAGFVSGRELTALFSYPIPLFVAPLIGLGVFLCAVLFLTVGSKLKPPSMNALNQQLMGRGHFIADAFLLFNSLAVLAGMLSAMDSLLDAVFPLSPAYSIIFGIIGAILINKGISGLIKGNLIFVPIITLAVIIICTLSISFPIKLEPLSGASAPSIIVYISMNMMLASTVYTSLNNLKKRDILICSAVLALIITILLLLLIMALNSSQIKGAMPFIKLAKAQGALIFYLSIICLAAAIFTTMTTAMNGLNNWLGSLIGKGKYSAILVLLSGLIVSNLGFENIVTYLYPIIGIFGIVYIILNTVLIVRLNPRVKFKRVKRIRAIDSV